MDDVERGEVAEGGGGEDAVAVVQRVDVHYAQVQQLQRTGSEVSVTWPLQAARKAWCASSAKVPA